jgi:hypothetical protein
MSTTEDRLRDACRALADAIEAEPVRALPPQATRAALPLAPARSRAVRWLAPLAATVTVIAVIAAVTLIGRPAGQQGASARVPAGMPRYYVVLDFDPYPVTTAVVHDSVTGRVLAAVRVPAQLDNSYPPVITAGDDDSTFVILANETVRGHTPAAALFRLRVTAGGRSARLSRLPITFPPQVQGYAAALSPDGSELAIAQTPSCCGTNASDVIQVASMTTGASKTWTTQAPSGVTTHLSWADNKHLVFLFGQPYPVRPTVPAGYRELDITAPGSDLLASQPVVSAPPADPIYTQAEFLTPGGRAVITSTVEHVRGPDGRTTVIARIVELSARTGRLLRVLHQVSERATPAESVTTLDTQCNVLSLDPSGTRALIACFGFGKLADHRFTPLPGISSPHSLYLTGPNAWGTAAW